MDREREGRRERMRGREREKDQRNNGQGTNNRTIDEKTHRGRKRLGEEVRQAHQRDVAMY